MQNNLLWSKKIISASALVGEETIAQSGRQNFFVFPMCFSLNKAGFHFGSFIGRPNRSRILNTKLGTFSKPSYKSCYDAVKHLFRFFILKYKKQCFVFFSEFPIAPSLVFFNKKTTDSQRDFPFAVVQPVVQPKKPARNNTFSYLSII